MEIRRSYDRLISTMGFPILVRRHLYIESAPCTQFPQFILTDFCWTTRHKITHTCSSVNGVWMDFRDIFRVGRTVTRSFDVLFDLRLNKRLSKQSWRRWFETPSRSLWHHHNEFYDPFCCVNITWIWFKLERNVNFIISLYLIRSAYSVQRYYYLALNWPLVATGW